MEKMANLCDSCNNRVANYKCAGCKKDLCNYCGKSFYVLHLLNMPFPQIKFCKGCYSRLEKIEMTEEQAKSISDNVADHLASVLLLKEIEQ